MKDEDLRPGLADRDPELKAWLDAPEQAYNRFATLAEAMAYAMKTRADALVFPTAKAD